MEQATVIDYTKFRLKPDEEIKEVLNHILNISVVLCNKCYKEFETDNEPECNKLAELVESEQVKISKCVPIDFLCNKHHTQEKIASLDTNGAQVVGVVSCGLGIQVVADILAEKKKRVVSLADSIPQSGNATTITSYHGIALGPEKCAGCAQCYLNLTGGLCPVVNCAKSLLNGACGGTNNGKCEIDSDKDCVWEQIYQRLKKQGRTLSGSVEVRDYNKFDIEEKLETIEFVQNKRDMSFYGGLYPQENKEQTQHLKIEEFKEPEQITVFLGQHIGAPAECLVKVGDKVKAGQKIGRSKGFVSTTVHASVSGKVTAIEDRIHPAWSIPSTAVIIENDKDGLLDESVAAVTDWEKASNEKLLAVLQDKGLVGLGGAMFPTHVKLAPPEGKIVDTLLINGCECEPYLNADNRLMIEQPEELIKGINIAKKILGVENVFIGIEENKPEAIEIMGKIVSGTDIKIVTLKTKYPQGSEKMLIKKMLDKQVPEGGLPMDVGVVVLNVSTALAMYQAVYQGRPLLDRVITIAGEDLKKTGNFRVKIGTPLKDIIQFCSGITDESIFKQYEIKMGGPFMGIVQQDLSSATIKGTNGFTFLKKSAVALAEDRACIKCGRCLEVCPMELAPLMYVYHGTRQEWDKTSEYKVKNCIECRGCEYICSSKINILSHIKKAKKNADN